jgi:serine protease Do
MSNLSTSIEGLGFAIPSNTVKKVASELIEKGYVSGRTKLGVNILEVTDLQTAMMYRLPSIGLYIGSVNDGTEFEVGDCILEIDGQKVNTVSSIKAILETHNVGDVLMIKIIRDEQNKIIPVKLKEQIPEKLKNNSEIAE